MSFTTAEPAPARVNRSELAVPASNPRMIEKAAASEADVVLLDLEDSVAPDEKARARRNAVEAINDLDWGGRTLSLRINGLDTHFMYRDLVEVLEAAGERLDLVMIPKVGTAADVYAVDVLVTQIEAARGRKRRLGFELQIETALGMANADAIAAASPRNESLHFGSGDYAASIGARTTGIGGQDPRYGVLAERDGDAPRAFHRGDMWHYALARIVVAARAHGLRPVDGPYADFSDPEGFRAHAARAAALGCEGKWAIHPVQIPLANEVFSPAPEEVAQARRILEALDLARREGRGAVALDGRMIDVASIRQAQALVAKADRIAARSAPR